MIAETDFTCICCKLCMIVGYKNVVIIGSIIKTLQFLPASRVMGLHVMETNQHIAVHENFKLRKP